ncbi:MAG TPA: hypothetical protein VI456_04230 [Polyangia bacterium]
MRFASLVCLAILTTVVFASTSQGFEELTPPEALGMGGAARAWATGDEGPLMNPSGMSLTKAYALTGSYEYASRLSDQFLHASIVDSTSPFNLAGGLYYTYHAQSPSGAPSGSGHEAGFALSYPFGPYVSIGTTVKYFKLLNGDAYAGHDGGVTFDVGATIRPTQILSIGAVGTNLRDLGSSEATRAIGYGLALLPFGSLLVTADGLTRRTADNQTGRKGTSLMGGAAYTFAGKVAGRAGGGYDASTGNGYLTVGASAVSAIGAIDVGLRQDVTSGLIVAGGGEARETVLGIGFRLFIPASQSEDSAPEFQDLHAPVTNP